MADSQPISSPQDIPQPVQDSWRYHPDYHKTCEFLGIDKYDRDDFKVAQKVSLLYDWAEIKSKSKNILDNISKIKTLQRELGVVSQGKDLTNRLWEYVRLEMEREKLDTTMAAYKELPREEIKPKRKTVKRESIKDIIKRETDAVKKRMRETMNKKLEKMKESKESSIETPTQLNQQIQQLQPLQPQGGTNVFNPQW